MFFYGPFDFANGEPYEQQQRSMYNAYIHLWRFEVDFVLLVYFHYEQENWQNPSPMPVYALKDLTRFLVALLVP